MKKGRIENELDRLVRRVKSEPKTKYSRFDLENCLCSMYQISDDLGLALDDEEKKAVIKMHMLRCDNLMEVFEDMIMNGKIL